MDLPDKSSPHIRLVVATEEQYHELQLANSSEWRGALSLEAYLRREKHLYNQELTKEGGLTPWVLVYQPTPDAPQKVLCGCETFNKTALVRRGNKVEDVLSRSIASVFCPESRRGRGYAGRMMDEVGKVLKSWKGEDGQACLFSVLYSDIGKQFYTARGWHPFPSAGITLPAASAALRNRVRLLKKEDLAELCAIDENLIRRRLAELQTSKRIAFAIAPNHRQIAWHHAREDFVGEELYNRNPAVKGAMVGDTPGARVFCYWTRVWSNPSEAAPNTLHILRLVIEDESFTDFAPASTAGTAGVSDSVTVRAVADVLSAAQNEAAQWDMEEVMLWNPTSTTLAAAQMLHSTVHVVHREDESIPSLQWYGEEPWQEVDWIELQKYSWC